tara:strand:- start:431 stop:1393 length:963 start_codon:yes stop_codon:yes gene_type:complete
MPIVRDTITFWLPESLVDVLTPPGLASTGGRIPRKLYLNPQTINIREQKLISETLTKGGYIVQYWGEQLPEIGANGTTGSAGIEGINILRDIYRHEQAAMRNVFLERQDRLAVAARESAIAKGLQDDGQYSGGEAILDLVTGGAYSSLKSGISNSIDIITDAAAGGSYFDVERNQFSAPANLASFATTIDMHFQGEVFRGFFTNFSYTEEANSPGLFSYQFSFKVTRRVGVRKNFMPFHRSPVTYDGETRQASTPPLGQALGELSFPYEAGNTQSSLQVETVDVQNNATQTSNSQLGIDGTDSQVKTGISLNRNQSIKGS